MKLMRHHAWLFLLTYLSIGSAKALPGKIPDNGDPKRARNATSNYHGVISDDQNHPLANAQIILRGRQAGTRSDVRGQFALNANVGDTIDISLDGYRTQNYVFGTDLAVRITLDQDKDKPLYRSTVVQQPYTTVPQDLNIASTDAVYSNDLVKSPVTSFRNALTGRLAGLYTLQTSGLAGADGASLTLRGQTPIIMVDGVVVNISTFDLEEIESITVLKDALATAMLGVRGAHGAILVTTKKGSASKQQISLTAQTAIHL